MSVEPPSTSSPATSKAPSSRLGALDAFRGAVILGMILVNNPGDWGNLYPPLAHAAWHGWTPTDLVFPFFLFIVGASMAYAFRKYRHGAEIDRAVYLRIGRRVAALFALGLLLNSAGQWLRVPLAGWSALSAEPIRIPGVLQRIALAYFAGALLVLHSSVRVQVGVAAALLLGYWGLLAALPQPGDYAANLSPDANLVRAVDVAVLGKAHMFTQATTEPTDPEGLLSTLPSIFNLLAGYWIGLALQRQAISWRLCGQLLLVGLLGYAAGEIWGRWLPINKKLWTSSYAVLSSGLAAAALAVCLAAFDVGGRRRGARPLEIVGVNAIFVFVASGIVGRWLTLVRVGTATSAADGGPAPTLKQWIYERGFASWISPPEAASLAFALATVAAWWLALAYMARRGWAFRV